MKTLIAVLALALACSRASFAQPTSAHEDNGQHGHDGAVNDAPVPGHGVADVDDQGDQNCPVADQTIGSTTGSNGTPAGACGEGSKRICRHGSWICSHKEGQACSRDLAPDCAADKMLVCRRGKWHCTSWHASGGRCGVQTVGALGDASDPAPQCPHNKTPACRHGHWRCFGSGGPQGLGHGKTEDGEPQPAPGEPKTQGQSGSKFLGEGTGPKTVKQGGGPDGGGQSPQTFGAKPGEAKH